MKKMNYFKMLLAGALVIAIASCAKEESPVNNQNQNGQNGKGNSSVTLGLQLEPSTKVTLSEEKGSGKFAWETGDQIAVWVGTDAENGCFQACEVNADKNISVDLAGGKDRFHFAVYPNGVNPTYSSTDGLTITLPDTYKLSDVSDTKVPLPMVAVNNNKSDVLTFYNVGGLLRLTVKSIPEGTEYLKVDFNGNKVCGAFSIADPKPGNSTIATVPASNAGDVITITDLGKAEPAIINIPLPTGKYGDISVYAMKSGKDGGDVLLSAEDQTFEYAAKRAVGKVLTASPAKVSTIAGTAITPNKSAIEDLQSTIKFKFVNGSTPINKIRFVRIFSEGNKLLAKYDENNNKNNSNGPVTAADSKDLPNNLYFGLRIDATANDALVFQLIDADGKVYSGSKNAPADGYKAGQYYNETVEVNVYTFTVASGKKVYFSPGDLGLEIVDGNSNYSFTEPFTTWGHGNTTNYNNAASAAKSVTKRVWFDFYFESGLANGTVYGISNWRIPNRAGKTVDSYEWNYLVNSRTMNAGVNRYYKVTIPGHQYCLLLPPDETQSTDIEDDLSSGSVTNYGKYLAKGFVLLFNTNRGLYASNKWSWGGSTSSIAKQGWYWTVYNGSNRYYFTWPNAGPKVDWGSNRMRNHIRYIRDVE